MAEAVRLRNPPANAVSRPARRHFLAGLVQLVRRRRREYQGKVETDWRQCLLYALWAWPLVFVVALLLTLLSSGFILLLPEVAIQLRDGASEQVWPYLSSLFLPLLILGYGASFLDCVFASALAGEVRYLHWPGLNIVLVLRSAVRWLICFLAGPALPAGASLVYWLRGGDLEFLDWLVLAELSALTIGLWFLLLLAVNRHDRLRDVNPVRVAALFQRLGHRLAGLAALASVLGLAHAWLAWAALETIHRHALSGLSLLFLCWASGLFFATFLFRWAGAWFYWDQRRR